MSNTQNLKVDCESLKKIRDFYTESRKKKDGFSKLILATLIGDIELKGINKRRNPTDEETYDVVKKFISNAKGSIIDIKEKNGDVNRIPEIEKEIELLSQFQPPQVSNEDVKLRIKSIIENKNIDSMRGMGIIMGTLSKEFGKNYDASLANKLVKELLS